MTAEEGDQTSEKVSNVVAWRVSSSDQDFSTIVQTERSRDEAIARLEASGAEDVMVAPLRYASHIHDLSGLEKLATSMLLAGHLRFGYDLRAEIAKLRGALPNPWRPIAEYESKNDGQAFIGYSAAWIDADYCPNGVRECFFGGETFLSPKWDNERDEYFTDATPPSHFMPLPPGPGEKT